MNFPEQLRNAYEAKYRSVASLHAALVRVYGEEAISMNTIKRLMRPGGYRPRGRRPYLQLKRVLPDLALPVEAGVTP